jgi:uncharacterized LabA/DUF88 family protein
MDALKKLAVLIDADNESYRNIEAIFSELAKYGSLTSKRIYGDWSSGNLAGWREKLPEMAITPIQQFANTVGKNSTDSALIIDAMDLMHSARFDGFCIVSSDSDFTRLVTRIREQGLLAIGVGRKKTPRSLVLACDKFILVENLEPVGDDRTEPEDDAVKQKGSAAPVQRIEGSQLRMKTDLVRLLRDSFDEAVDDDGWTSLGRLGQAISKRAPDFDSRSYGYSKFKSFLQAIELFEFVDRASGNGGQQPFVRKLPNKTKSKAATNGAP